MCCHCSRQIHTDFWINYNMKMGGSNRYETPLFAIQHRVMYLVTLNFMFSIPDKLR